VNAVFKEQYIHTIPFECPKTYKQLPLIKKKDFFKSVCKKILVLQSKLELFVVFRTYLLNFYKIKLMKIRSIIALTLISFYVGVTNHSNAQEDSAQSFVSYMVKSPWLVGVGFGYVQNYGQVQPFDYKNKMNFYPGNVLLEKSIYGFRKWKFAKGMNLQYVFGREGWNPTHFIQSDLNLKWSFNYLWGGRAKWFDPYVVIGGGFTSMRYRFDDNLTFAQQKKIDSTYIGHDRFINLNVGGGANFWVFENVAINTSAVAKFNLGPGGTNYISWTGGLVFRIGRGAKENNAEEKVEEKAAPASNYKRTKEEEDALIHLREHLNK